MEKSWARPSWRFSWKFPKERLRSWGRKWRTCWPRTWSCRRTSRSWTRGWRRRRKRNRHRQGLLKLFSSSSLTPPNSLCVFRLVQSLNIKGWKACLGQTIKLIFASSPLTRKSKPKQHWMHHFSVMIFFRQRPSRISKLECLFFASFLKLKQIIVGKAGPLPWSGTPRRGKQQLFSQMWDKAR